jgi:hypothetical protein
MLNHKKTIFIFFLLLAILPIFANAELMISSTIDKDSLSTNEVALLTIKVLNDSDRNIRQLTIKVTTEDDIRFIEENEEKTVLAKTIDGLNANKGVELKAKLKAISTKKGLGNIYVYYGEGTDPKTANVIQIQTKEIPISVTATAEKKSFENGDKIIVTFKLTNFSKSSIYKINAGIIPPSGFDANNLTTSAELLQTNASLSDTFELTAPIDTRGTQTITLTYGYFDSNSPHYFEKNFNIDFQKPNYDFLILIGFVVLAIAVYVFIKKDKKTDIKGSEEKKK